MIIFQDRARTNILKLVSLPLLSALSSSVYAEAPSQPMQLRTSVYSDSSAEVLWKRSTDDVIVVGYEISVDGNVVGVFDQLSYYRDDFEPGQQYQVSVIAVDNEGNRSSSAMTTFVAGDSSPQDPNEPPDTSGNSPAPPGSLRSTVYSSKELELFWARVHASSLHYEVTVNGQVRGTTNGTSFYMDGLAAGTRYDVEVVAVDESNSRSAPATLTATTLGGSGDPSVDPPTDVVYSDTQLEVYSRSAAEIFWVSPPNAVTTIVLRNGQKVGQTDGTSYYDDERQRGVTYRYELVAIDGAGTEIGRSLLDDSGQVVPPAVELPVVDPVALNDLRLVVYSRTAAELIWEKAPTAVTTLVTRDGVYLGQTSGNSFYDGNRERDTTHQYELVSSNEAGQVVARSVTDGTDEPPVVDPPKTDVFSPLADDINLDPSVYAQFGYDSANVLRVDIRTVTTAGVCTADDLSGCTLADVLNDTDKYDKLTVDIPVHFMSDDFADDGSVNNAELRLRGGGSRFAPQKSFRIKLDSKKDLWRGERYLQLNKHPYESSRQRNKLAMDLMSRVAHLPSFRTQFVNLWIDDGEGPVDYGLFTHVERSNDDYLDVRGLDKDGNFYKAENFQFSEADLEDIRVDEEGEPLDEDRFESSLAIEEGKDHRALEAMLSALHDPERSFESVLEQYFNKNNVLAWMASNLLLRHADGTRHNYLLYNPSDSEKFYFAPWDYDATLSRWNLPTDSSYSNADLKTRVNYGYSLGSSNVFMENFYKLPGIHDELLRAIDYIQQNAMDATTITAMSEHNADLITPFMTRLPDSEFNTEYNKSPTFASRIAHNADAVATQFHVPIPPTLFMPEREGDTWKISWNPGYSPTGDTLSYDLQISSDPAFAQEDIAVEILDIEDSPITVKQHVDNSHLPQQTYYVRLIARSSSQPMHFWVPARNRVEDGDNRYYGLIQFDTF